MNEMPCVGDEVKALMLLRNAEGHHIVTQRGVVSETMPPMLVRLDDGSIWNIHWLRSVSLVEKLADLA